MPTRTPAKPSRSPSAAAPQASAKGSRQRATPGARKAAAPATGSAAVGAKAVVPAPKKVKTPEPPKAPKAKLVRDSFTMPQADFALVAALKERALNFKRPTKKSELLRAGLQALAGLDDKALQAALDALTPLKPGRPKKGD